MHPSGPLASPPSDGPVQCRYRPQHALLVESALKVGRFAVAARAEQVTKTEPFDPSPLKPEYGRRELSWLVFGRFRLR